MTSNRAPYGGRSAGRAGRLAWALLALSVVVAATAVAVQVWSPEGAVVTLSFAPTLLVFAVVGGLVAARHPANPIGWLFLGLAVLGELSLLSESYAGWGAGGEQAPPGSSFVAWVSFCLGDTGAPALIALSFLFYPNGRLPSARWRAVAWAVVALTASAAASRAFLPGVMDTYGIANPFGLEGAGDVLRVTAAVSLQLLVAPAMLLCASSLLVRTRRASGDERQQLKWFAYAAVLLGGELVLAGLLPEPSSSAGELAALVVFQVALLLIPVAMGVAILRYRLYDIDLLINRTLVYASLTAALSLVYVVGVVGIGGALRAVVGQESNNVAVAASTLGVAALFRPTRARVQDFIDRRFYRRRYDAAKTLEAFSARLREQVDLDELRTDLLATVRESMHPSHVSLWLRGFE